MKVLDGGSVSHVSMHRHLPVREAHRIFLTGALARGINSDTTCPTLSARLPAYRREVSVRTGRIFAWPEE